MTITRVLIMLVLAAAAATAYLISRSQEPKLDPVENQIVAPREHNSDLTSRQDGNEIETSPSIAGRSEDASLPDREVTTNSSDEGFTVLPTSDTRSAMELASAKARVIEEMFQKDPAGLAMRVEAFMAKNEFDEDWAPQAKSAVLDWFVGDASSDQNTIYVECVAEACYVDLLISYSEYLNLYRGKANNWSSRHIAGFLPTNFVVPAGDNYHRLYVFRDSIDLRQL